MRDLKFLNAYAGTFKPGITSSTTRKGTQWLAARPGEVVNLMITESRKVLGQAAVLTVTPTTYAEAIKDNSELAALLTAIYGDKTEPHEDFAVVTFVPLHAE